MDPSHVTKTTQRDHSNFRAMNDVMPKLVHRIALGTARLRLHNKAHSFKKLKPAEKNAERPPWKINASKILWMAALDAFQLKLNKHVLAKELTVILEIKQLSGALSPCGVADVTALENKGDTSRALKPSQESA